MTVKPVWIGLLLGAAAWGCQKDTGGTLAPQPPTAGLRYFDAVLDTTYMDFRVVDIVQFAPNAARAQFRSGGNPSGVTNAFFSPPYLPVLTGAHDIRVFLDSTDLATASTVMFDTTVTFVQGHNYTFILYGSARAKTLHALVLDDQPMATVNDGNVWVRTVDLATGVDTTGIGAAADVYAATAAPAAVSPLFVAPAFAKPTAYQRVPIGAVTGYATRAGTVTVAARAAFPAGVVGDTANDPIAGALVQNTGFTILILPRSTPGAGVPRAYATPGVFIMIDQQPPLTKK